MSSRYLLTSAFLVAALTTGALARTERNSFLNRNVSSTADLIAQIKKDPEVRARFERHFGKSAEQLSGEFSKLRLGRLAKAGDYWVYNVDEEGVIRAKLLHLKAGTPVFMDSAGRPVLKKSCGNAMKPGTDFAGNASEPMVVNPSDLREIPMVEEPSVLPLFTNNLEPASPLAPIIAQPPTLDTPGIANQPMVDTGGSGFVLPIGLLAGGGFFIQGGGGEDHSPVPEPATGLILGLGIGVPALVRRIRRAKP
jgi:hypothetical protein